VPKIQAPTVVEHHAAQRAALLDAARSLLSEGPASVAPGLADVAQRAGLARSSVYSYFSSREDLLDALVADTFPRWSAYVRERMARRATPGDKVLAYVDANVHLVARGDHALAVALSSVARSDALASSSRLLHDELRTPLVGALREHGSTDPEHMAELVQALVFAVSRLVEDGMGERRARALAHELLAPYLGTDRPRP
jgi:AcrR family transcriptional regulator